MAGRFHPLGAVEALGLHMSDVKGLNDGNASTLCVVDVFAEVLPSVEVNDASAERGS